MSFDPAALPPMSISERVDRLRPLIQEEECDALVVTNLTNVRYLTGFTGSAALLAVRPDSMTLVTDGRYDEQAKDEVQRAGVAVGVRIGGTAEQRQNQLVSAIEGAGKLGLEADNVTWAQQMAFDGEWFPEAELVATKGLVARLREVKDEGEVARIEAACAIADQALAAVRHRLAERPTEAEVALELELQMRRRGAEGISFDTIVAAGPNGAQVHHRAGQRRIEEGDLVMIDFGALVDGYHSDMTRTLSVGELSPTRERMWDVVYEAQAAGMKAAAAGVEAKAVDQACREVIREAGWEDAFAHSTGHGVGLDIHEAPSVAAVSEGTLAAGHVVTVEPGVYLPEHGGVRIEDTIAITANGTRTLTQALKDRAV